MSRKNNSKRNFKSGSSRNFRESGDSRGGRSCDNDGSSYPSDRASNTSINNKRGAKPSGTNDPAWYSANPALLRDAATFNFSNAIGTPIDLGPHISPLAIKGLCTMEVTSTFGEMSNPTSPINMASMSIYSYVRHANSGSKVYDAPDMMLYLMGMTQIYAYISYLQRLYGLAMLYSQQNRYMPKLLIEANHVNFDDLQSNLARFRYGIQVLIEKAASFYIPANMSIFKRSAFLFANIYTEGVSPKDQLYMLTPYSFYTYTLNTDASGMLKEIPFSPNAGGKGYYTVESLLDFGNDLLDNMLYQEDIQIMSGDILKAYGPGNILKLALMPEYYPIVPIMDVNVLEQFSNATVIDGLNHMDIIQDPSTHAFLRRDAGIQTSNPEDTIGAQFMANVYSQDRLLNVMDPNPSPEKVMESTRLMTTMKYLGASGSGPESYERVDLYAGSEVVRYCTVYGYLFSTSVQQSTERIRYYDCIEASEPTYTNSIVQVLLSRLGAMSNFNFHPQNYTYLQTGRGADAEFTVLGINFNLSNYTVLHAGEVQRLHEAAVLNMLFVPAVTKG